MTKTGAKFNLTINLVSLENVRGQIYSVYLLSDSFLDWRGTCVDTILMGHLTISHQMLRTNCPAQFPASDRECLSGAADCDGPFPHVRQGGHSNHLAAIKNLKYTKIGDLK
jgi:hypothetical protein